MKKKAVKTISIVMSVIAVLGTMYVMVSAYFTTPEINNSRPITTYTTDSDDTAAYGSSSLTSEKGSIPANTKICIYKIGKNTDGEYFAYCSYTNENGNQCAYIPLSSVTNAKMPAMALTARADVNTYRRATGSDADVRISKGDTVYKLATENGRTQVIFGNTENDASGWTMTWILTEDYDSSIKPEAKATITSAFTNVSDFIQNA